MHQPEISSHFIVDPEVRRVANPEQKRNFLDKNLLIIAVIWWVFLGISKNKYLFSIDILVLEKF